MQRLVLRTTPSPEHPAPAGARTLSERPTVTRSTGVPPVAAAAVTTAHLAAVPAAPYAAVDVDCAEPAAAWDLLHRIIDASPDVDSGTVEGVVRPDGPLPSWVPWGVPPDPRWSRRAVRAPVHDAEGGGGDGVVVGHADTGWAPHPAIPDEAWDLARAFNAFDGSTDARDPNTAIDFFDGHGTGTASVLVAGGDGSSRAPFAFEGIVPRARVVPARCANGVVLFSDLQLTRALDHFAGLDDLDVVTISLGGFPAPALREALRRLVWDRDVIVVAAAGQQSPFCLYPAAYEDCIAVAASTSTDRPWRYTTASPRVDVAAPGHGVCVADFAGDGRRPVVKAGRGTSYATPQIAGAAALWIAHHGRTALRGRYAGGPPLSYVFRHLLRSTSRRPDPLPPAGADDARFVDFLVPLTRWRADRYGAGIVDIGALLRAPLPSPQDVPVPRAQPARAHWLSALANVLALSDQASSDVLDQLGLNLGRHEEALTAELVTHLMELDPTTIASLQSLAARQPPAQVARTLRTVCQERVSTTLTSAMQA